MPSSVAAIQRITGWRTQLWTLDGLPGGFLEPVPVYRLCGHPELDEQVVRVVGRFGLAPLFLPEAEEGAFVAAHNHPSVGSADEFAAIDIPCVHCHLRTPVCEIFGIFSYGRPFGPDR
jgi:hypothetical protein